MSEQVHFLTPEGKRRLEKELERLIKVKRPQIAANLKAAIEEGDLTENAGYEESKRDQAFLEGRIRDIEAILADAQVLEDVDQHEVVALGTRVTVSEDGVEHPETYQIVGSAEADPSNGRISNASPLGKALMGRQVGEKVQVDTPGGILSFVVLAIE